MIDLHGYNRYLEVGCGNDDTFAEIICRTKVGVDSTSGGTLRMTSDEFFAQNDEKFDLIFIDGYHHHDQVFKDITNALAALTTRGMLVLHDCSPRNPYEEGPHRCYTAWRAFAQFRDHPRLDSMVCNFDYGVGLIMQRPNRSPFDVGLSMDELTFDDLVENRVEILNLKEADEVIEWVLN